jgi:hypothetical protein
MNTNLKFVKGRVVCYVDLELKNSYQFENGTKIVWARGYNNFNRRETQPINGVVISAENIMSGAEILFNHNSVDDSNRVFDADSFSGETVSKNIQYYSIPETECYAWRMGNGDFSPTKNFQFGLRVFEPYVGILNGVTPTLIKDVMFVTTGKLKGKVCNMLKSSDYEMVFQGSNGREQRIIRFRHSDNHDLDLEEVITINGYLTEKVNSGELLVGLTDNDAKQISIQAYAD